MNNPKNTHNGHGHHSSKPGAIPKKGWKDILIRVKDQIKEDHISIVSAGVAFYFFLALFPAIAAIVSIYGLAVEPAQVEQQLNQSANFLPAEAYEMVAGILQNTASKSSSALGWSLVLSILISLWSANKATTAMFEGVNIAYHESDDRNFFIKNGTTLLVTLGIIITGIISMALVIAFPALIDSLGLPPVIQTVLALLRWIILAAIIYFAISMIYKFAPSRTRPKFSWMNTGAIFATIVWIGGSLLFTLYIDNFGNYDEMYGSIAAVVILMLWFYLTGFIIILGAEINSEIEHQTVVGTTVGGAKSMGQQGAYYADHEEGEEKRNGKHN
jgi:membrane protein